MSSEPSFSLPSIAELISSYSSEPEHVSLLEAFVVAQVKRKEPYHFAANQHLLKIYSVTPDSTKLDILAKLLLLALGRFSLSPVSSDFHAFCYLISRHLLNEAPLKNIVEMNTLLEQSQFRKFWQEREQIKALIEAHQFQLAAFDDFLRLFIASTVNLTWNSILSSTLRGFLNLTTSDSNEQFDQFLEQQKWEKKDDGKTIFLNHANFIRSNFFVPSAQKNEVISIDAVARLVDSRRA